MTPVGKTAVQKKGKSSDRPKFLYHCYEHLQHIKVASFNFIYLEGSHT